MILDCLARSLFLRFSKNFKLQLPFWRRYDNYNCPQSFKRSRYNNVIIMAKALETCGVSERNVEKKSEKSEFQMKRS